MSGRIKQKVVKATLADKDVLEMFNGVVGNSKGVLNMAVAHPKYERIASHVERFIKLLTVIRDSKLMEMFPGPRDHLNAYATALGEQYKASFNAPNMSQYLPPPTIQGWTIESFQNVPADVLATFSECFEQCKKCNVVNTILVACKNLITHKKALANPDDLSDRFLIKNAGISFCPLPDLPQVNFKQIYIDDRLTAENKKFVLMILHKMYVIGHDLYDAISAPDVDIEEFIGVIMSSIGEVKKHIPRCDQAFAKIADSVGLLRNNFGNYYKDYVASNNSTIIMENFVIDVSKNSGSSPTVTAQFRRIITHYRKIASQQANDPRLQSLFKQVDKNFQELASKEKGGENDDESESASESDDDAGADKSTKDAAMPTGDVKLAATEAKMAADLATATTAAMPTPSAIKAMSGNADEGLADELDKEDENE